MGMLRALFANEPLMYREALADALQSLRPEVEVDTTEPEDLDAEIQRLHPHLVVCSRSRSLSHADVPIWVTLYPAGENRAEVVTAGGRATLVGIEFDDFLAVVDGAELMCRFAQGEGLKV